MGFIGSSADSEQIKNVVIQKPGNEAEGSVGWAMKPGNQINNQATNKCCLVQWSTGSFKDSSGTSPHGPFSALGMTTIRAFVIQKPGNEAEGSAVSAGVPELLGISTACRKGLLEEAWLHHLPGYLYFENDHHKGTDSGCWEIF